ncbi:hypothetical protein [Novosphingobium sp. JCM 18896]|uniref:hypothetical protein n=1 Tax=Novosphingobium sp. JCM 18896 TaxID=2989731 RepID=UPI0022221764|nr:hypothetical protein [Novosphingobium sp. JCM 18896]
MSAEQAREIARAYLLEESALFAVLREEGGSLIVYPGAIDSIEALCEGRFAGAPEPLKELAFASLSLRKRGLFFADGSATRDHHFDESIRRAGGRECEHFAEEVCRFLSME